MELALVLATKMTNSIRKINFIVIPVVLCMTGILFSCVNDLDTIQKVTSKPNTPDEVTQDLNLHYTDSGYARIKVYAKLAETINTPARLTRLMDFVKVDFYSEDGKVISTLTSLYGEVDYETGLMMVKDSVVLHNIAENQILETEILFYNQKDSTVYTDKYVILKKEGEGIIGRGKGIRTTPFGQFTKGDIFEPEGKLID